MVLSGIPEGLTTSLGDNRVRQSSPNSAVIPAEISSLPGQIPTRGPYLLSHRPSGSITGHGDAALWLLFLSSFREKTVNQRWQEAATTPAWYNGTGPSRRASHCAQRKVQQYLDIVSCFFCPLSATFRKLKWNQLQRSE